jgi:uncharacterized protein (TIGR00730 family)
MKRYARVVTVFGSSRPQPHDALYAQAQALGVALAENGLLVCTGGYGGVMEAVSRGAKQAGGRTIGITARFFRSRANPWIDEEIRVATWRERLFELIERGHGYVTCPGGTGTLVELAIVWEMLNKGVMKKKPVIVFGDFWRPVIECVRETERAQSSVWGERAEPLIQVAASPRAVAEHLSRHLGARPRVR